MSIFLTLLGLLPSILQSVVAVEGAFKKAPGAVKKQIVLTPVLTAAKKLGAPVTPELVTAAEMLIDTTVASLNSVGLLGKPAPIPAGLLGKPVAVAAKTAA